MNIVLQISYLIKTWCKKKNDEKYKIHKISDSILIPIRQMAQSITSGTEKSFKWN